MNLKLYIQFSIRLINNFIYPLFSANPTSPAQLVFNIIAQKPIYILLFEFIALPSLLSKLLHIFTVVVSLFPSFFEILKAAVKLLLSLLFIDFVVSFTEPHRELLIWVHTHRIYAKCLYVLMKLENHRGNINKDNKETDPPLFTFLDILLK